VSDLDGMEFEWAWRIARLDDSGTLLMEDDDDCARLCDDAMTAAQLQ
jgi:hypothetical protein